jgi:alkylation response protein AidB-like acyl-CoA dehydrogenase
MRAAWFRGSLGGGSSTSDFGGYVALRRFIAPTLLDDGTTAVFLVDPAAPGVTRERAVATTFEPLGMLSLRGIRVSADEVLGAPGDGAAIVEWIRQRALAGVCATAAGVCAEALRLTAAHVSEREQFGHKIATFQAVAQRAADAYVDTRAIALTARQAAWRLAAGLPAAEALAIAKWWAADGGQRVAHAAQHLHGGIGVDTSYPLHRYFRWAKQLELSFGAATAQLRHFGVMLADRAPDARGQ